MLKKIQSILNSIQKLSKVPYQITNLESQIEKLEIKCERTYELMGKNMANQFKNSPSLLKSEFTIYAQGGDDGIIQYLIQNLPVKEKKFIEFGVQNYMESNTRFLLTNDYWSGLIIDANKTEIEFIKNHSIYQTYDLTAVQSFITKDNINELFINNGYEGEIGLLSIDIDGNDYWIWEIIESVSPMIVIIEYNHRYGPDRKVTIPYTEGFDRTDAHHSNIYYGASLSALVSLSRTKGYRLVGCNPLGNNAYFVKDSSETNHIPTKSSREAFVQGKFRESRNQDGTLAFLSLEQEIEIIKKQKLIEISICE